MKLLVYSAKQFEIPFLNRANKNKYPVTYTEDPLDSRTAIQAVGFKAISIFSGDDASHTVLQILWDLGVRYITLRSVGHNNIHVKTAKRLGFRVAHTPDYSPHAIAEHAVALLLAFNRKLILANERVHRYNFLQDGLMGSNLHRKTFGIIGTGRIGSIMVKIIHGFGCRILVNDSIPDDDLVELCDVTYVSLEELCRKSDIISIHIPLNYENHQLINKEKFSWMKKNVVLINTARGGIIDTKALISALEQNDIGGYCTDVYEKEKGIFFKNNSEKGIKDEKLKKLLSFPNVLLTPHQAFITKEALKNIADATFQNINDWVEKGKSVNELTYEALSS